MRLSILLLAAAALTAVPSPADAQLTPAEPSAEPPPELVTDRPDQTESAAVVPAGFHQLETGLAYERLGNGPLTVRTVSGPGTLARIGLGGRTELRLGWEGWVDQDIDVTGPSTFDRSVSGVGDGEVGVKVKLREESGALPEMAILAGVSLPVGDDELTSDEYEPSVRLAFAHTLSDRLGLAYNLGAERSHEREESFTRFLYTVALGAGLTDRLGAFVEVFGEEPESGGPGGSQVSLDGGVTYLLRPNLQLDAYAGAGVTDHAPDWLAGMGVSVRWPR